MAVAVKTTPEATTLRLGERLVVASLLGALYVLASILVLFWAVPRLWWWAWENLGLATGSPVGWALLVVAMAAAGFGLVFLGIKLAGAHPPHGLRAGIFFAFVGIPVVGLSAQILGMLLESIISNTQLFGEMGPVVGIALTVAVATLLAVLGLRYFVRPGVERWLINVEDQGWFTLAPYKRSQGQRVRRATILGILVLASCGLYTMIAHRTLPAEPPDWQIRVPFTSQELTLLPTVRLTVPLLLAFGAFWVGYRVVNYPPFADFLIATEAELNKVSWTTRKRLIQDTIVVLVTVFLLTVFLFLVDMVWAKILTGVGVLKIQESKQTTEQKEQPW